MSAGFAAKEDFVHKATQNFISKTSGNDPKNVNRPMVIIPGHYSLVRIDPNPTNPKIVGPQ